MTEPIEITPAMRAAVLREQALRECSTYGHDYQTITMNMGTEPISMVCTRCNRSWHITPSEPRTFDA